MVRWIVRGLVAAVDLAGLIVGLVTLTSTRTPALPGSAPGYAALDMPAPLREGPFRLHLWYPSEDVAPIDLVGQNALF